MQVHLWGVRGGIASCAKNKLRHGGNTPCVAVRSSAGRWLVLDAGTGIRGFGETLMAQNNALPESTELSLLLSHFHWDHVQGLPFFGPLWSDRFAIDIYAAAKADQIASRVRHQFEPPFFPVPLTQAKARLRFRPLAPTQQIAGMQVTAFPQFHPGGSTGFRIEDEGAVLVYATDAEGGQAAADEELLRQARGAKLLILDAQYTPGESLERAGWGHGDWRRASTIALAAKVEQLLLFHHDPARTDRELNRIARRARRLFPQTEAACEGVSFTL